MKFRFLAFVPLFVFALAAAPTAGSASDHGTYDEESILDATKGFFGSTTKGLAELIQKIFKDQGQPNAYIAGEEVSGAIGIGLRYGEGTLHRKNGAKFKIYWQGPSVGFDLGGNASKVFTLIYHLKNNDEIFQRIPGAEGTYYLIGGVGVSYQQSGDLILAPIRTGVGLRGGINIGYLHYNRKHSWIPF